MSTETRSPQSETSKVKPKSSVIQIHPEGERIHPKKAEGRFAKLRIAAVLATQFVFYVIPWFNWNGRQAVIFNIPDRHFFIFGLSLGMGDLIYLALLLMICAFGLFWWTTIAGRLWCGYSCPQTVYTEIMLWIDNLVEGDRNKRLKLEKSPWNFTKIRIKATKALLIFLFCVWTGITFAGWFVPIRQFVPDLFAGAAGGGAMFAAAFYGFMTFFFAHVMREKVCLHMCPYARFAANRAAHARKPPTKKTADWAIASIAPCAYKFAPSVSTFATVCNTNVSAVLPALMPATKSWIKWAIRAA